MSDRFQLLSPIRAILAVSVVAVFLVGSNVWAAKPRCGDMICNGNETPETCSKDCTAPPPPSCNNNTVCESGETYENCPSDCPPPPPPSCNNDGVCNAGEDCVSCADCPGKTDGKPRTRWCCGVDGYCDAARCGSSCGSSVPVCGNGTTEYSEECDDGNLEVGDGCDAFCNLEASADPVPLNQFNIGDSIGEGEAANGGIGAKYHGVVWSTGYTSGDVVLSLNERFEVVDAAGYAENNATFDPAFNKAKSGAVMANFASQASAVAAAMVSVPPGSAGMVTVLLGNNDVCADSLGEMTNLADFEQQYRAGLDVLSAAPFSPDVNLLVSGLPAIYWLWEAKWNDFGCRIIWPFVPCQDLLANAGDDCASSTSRQNPDQVYPGDGPNCQRRKAFHARIRDEYNPILKNVLSEYQVVKKKLLNAEYVDIMDVRFYSQHINDSDCFHPSAAGHALMAEKQWCRSKWGAGDQACTP